MVPRPPNGRPSHEIGVAATLVGLFVIAQVTDQCVFHHFVYPEIYGRGSGRVLPDAGYLPLWGLVGVALVLHAWVPRVRRTLGRGSRRGLLLVGSAALGGTVAELLKLTFRRERPGFTDGVHVFRPWSDQPFATAQLGLPSSEAAVAFAAAAMLARLSFPRPRSCGMAWRWVRPLAGGQRRPFHWRRGTGGLGGIRGRVGPLATPPSRCARAMIGAGLIVSLGCAACGHGAL